MPALQRLTFEGDHAPRPLHSRRHFVLRELAPDEDRGIFIPKIISKPEKPKAAVIAVETILEEYCQLQAYAANL